MENAHHCVKVYSFKLNKGKCDVFILYNVLISKRSNRQLKSIACELTQFQTLYRIQRHLVANVSIIFKHSYISIALRNDFCYDLF